MVISRQHGEVNRMKEHEWKLTRGLEVIGVGEWNFIEVHLLPEGSQVGGGEGGVGDVDELVVVRVVGPRAKVRRHGGRGERGKAGQEELVKLGGKVAATSWNFLGIREKHNLWLAEGGGGRRKRVEKKGLFK
jgi:hypothetical protein